MEKYKCKLCFRSFFNGRALGGHMRSHMMNLPIPPKLAEEADSASSRSEQLFRQEKRRQYEQSENYDEDDKSLLHGLRENPKRSVKLVDPEFPMMMILQDRESETESSKNPTRRRSRRARRPDKPEPWAAEPEPASSISDATTEEDVAFCLMMMSRDNWMKRKRRSDRNDDVEVEREEEEEEQEDFENDDEDEESEFEGAEKRQQSGKCAKGRYKCETCDKVFRSYQALGGHRASHKKLKLGQFAVVSESNDNESVKQRVRERESNAVAEKKSHRCPVCLRVFSSGQALGGHKRSHVIAAAKTTSSIARSPVVVLVDRASSKSNKLGESLIDLNLPAPEYDDDDDEASQVSDAEFVNNAVVRQ